MKIHTYPDTVLRSPAELVKDIDGAIQDLVDEMIEIMYAAPGIGLAANQVGELKRVVVLDVCRDEGRRSPEVVINPEIVLSEGNIIHEESCLSVIDFSAEVSRKAQVKVRGVDRHGNPVDIEAEGLQAICLQHEIDHLNGILFIDHVSSLKRSLYKKRLKKKLKKSESQSNR